MRTSSRRMKVLHSIYVLAILALLITGCERQRERLSVSIVEVNGFCEGNTGYFTPTRIWIPCTEFNKSLWDDVKVWRRLEPGEKCYISADHADKVLYQGGTIACSDKRGKIINVAVEITDEGLILWQERS